MSASLYDVLFGFFEDGTRVTNLDDKNQTIISVKDNVTRILNSRAGTIDHLSDYGLPDMSMIYQALPTSAYTLVRAMEQTLLKYEPRLSHISIELKPSTEIMVLSYELVCYFKKGGLVKYGTVFDANGKVKVDYKNKKN